MFNRNGSNNGNGSANGVHKETAIVARNGNGHKPDAAIVSEHELLWDGLSPAVTQALGQPLDPELVSQRKGRAGKFYDYLEGHLVIEQANRIFGYGGWGYELVGDVTLRQVETVDTQTGEVKVASAYSAPVRVTVAGALPRTDLGVHPVAEETQDGHDTAMKGAVTDGLKRAFRSFGIQFGNGFYGDQPQVGNVPQPQRVPAQTNGNAGQEPGQRTAPRRRPRSPAQAAHSRSLLSRASTRTRCGPPSWTSTGKSIDDLTAAELGSASGGRRQQAAADAAGPGRLAKQVASGHGFERGRLLRGAAPLSHYRTRRQRR